MDPTSFRRRLPAIEKKISEITEQDIRVSILGTVVLKKDERVVIDDGTGKIDVVFAESQNLEPKQLVRVFGKIIAMQNGVELQGEFFQDMSKLDIELWKKVAELEK